MCNVIFPRKPFFERFLQLSLFLALSLEQDIPDYDMDSADEMWFDAQTKNELTAFKFEQMMDRLEKITVCSLDDAKALVRRNEVNQDVFDYWVNKRLKTVNIEFIYPECFLQFTCSLETSFDIVGENGKSWKYYVQ